MFPGLEPRRVRSIAFVLSIAAMLGLRTSVPVRAAGPSAENLFNGRDLDGWYSFLVDTRYADPRAVFTVTNGMIRISGDGLGYLATRRLFTNYHLTVEFRWGQMNFAWGGRVGKARDSGIFLHAIGSDGNSHDGNGAFMAAVECNIFQGAVGDLLLIRGTDENHKRIAPRLTAKVAPLADHDGWFTWRRDGEPKTIEGWGRINWFGKDPNWRDLLDFRGPRDLEEPPGKWNVVECICRDGTVQIRLNGEVVNEAYDVWPRSGKILLQSEGSEIFFRRVALSAL